MDVDTFYEYFPQFKDTADQIQVQAKLNEATVRMGGPGRRWGSYATPPVNLAAAGGGLNIADIAQANLAAWYLTESPFGGETRLQLDGKKSPYQQKWEELCSAVVGPIVSGGYRPGGYGRCGP